MSKEYVHHFHHLTLSLLTEKEREDLHKSLRRYQRTNDVATLADFIKQLINTPERSRLLPYIRAPMSISERNQFDALIGVQNYGILSSPRPEFLGRMTTPANGMLPSERCVNISGTRGNSMGFSIRGGSEYGLGIFVSNIKPGSPAAIAGLRLGDQIVKANGVDLHCVANSGAVKVLSSSAHLCLVVLRCGKVPEWRVARERVLWYDVSLCRVVPTPPVSESPITSSTPGALVERKVVIRVDQGTDYIGLNVRGGRDYGTGVYVSRVDRGGLAERVGLSIGDQIVKVNDVSYLSITHTDAVDTLRASTHLIITIRSVGKYPVCKELHAEYTWSDGGSTNNLNNGWERSGLSKTEDNTSRRYTQRTRARESSIDLTHLNVFHDHVRNNPDFSDLDNVDGIEELDDGLEVESSLCYPRDNDIMFGKNFEHSWRNIDSLNDNNGRADDLTRAWSVDNKDSLAHYRDDSDMSDRGVDYTSFLERTSLIDQHAGARRQVPPGGGVSNRRRDDDEVVIETVIEEGVTSFASPPTSANRDADVFRVGIEPVYSEVADFKRNGSQSGRSSTSSSVPSSPIYATVDKKSKKAPDVAPKPTGKMMNGVPNDGYEDDDDAENINSQIKILEQRKSHLGSWEITRVAGGSSGASSPALSEQSFDSSDKKKIGTWSSIKKKLSGSFRIKGSKKRPSLPSGDEMATSPVSPTESSRQKGVFERSFGSQMLNSPTSDRYNLMSMLEDHARVLLAEDECKAVVRHVRNYHENKDLPRLVELLLAILDKPDKKMLLVDVRNVIAPGHIEQFDRLVAHCNIHGYDKWLRRSYSTPNETVNDAPVHQPVIKTPKAAIMTQANGDSNLHRVSIPPKEATSKRVPDKLVPQLTKADLKKTSSPLIILKPEDVEDDIDDELEEMVYISKHKTFLGLELCGGKNDTTDQTIRVKGVKPGGAASDDTRLQPGIEIAKIDGKSIDGKTKEEAESILQMAFSVKNPVNLGILIRHSYHL